MKTWLECWRTTNCQLLKKVSQIKINLTYGAISSIPVGDITSYPLEAEKKCYYSIKSLLKHPNLAECREWIITLPYCAKTFNIGSLLFVIIFCPSNFINLICQWNLIQGWKSFGRGIVRFCLITLMANTAGLLSITVVSIDGNTEGFWISSQSCTENALLVYLFPSTGLCQWCQRTYWA